jgi:hypothetical protein
MGGDMRMQELARPEAKTDVRKRGSTFVQGGGL